MEQPIKNEGRIKKNSTKKIEILCFIWSKGKATRPEILKEMERIFGKKNFRENSVDASLSQLCDEGKIERSKDRKGVYTKPNYKPPEFSEEKIQEAIDKILKIERKDGTFFYKDYADDDIHKIAVLMETYEDKQEFKELFAKFEYKLKLKRQSNIWR